MFMSDDDAIRIGEPERLQQDRIHDGKDRGVRANAERQRGDCCERERRTLREHSQRMTRVLQEGF